MPPARPFTSRAPVTAPRHIWLRSLTEPLLLRRKGPLMRSRRLVKAPACSGGVRFAQHSPDEHEATPSVLHVHPNS